MSYGAKNVSRNRTKDPNVLRNERRLSNVTSAVALITINMNISCRKCEIRRRL